MGCIHLNACCVHLMDSNMYSERDLTWWFCTTRQFQLSLVSGTGITTGACATVGTAIASLSGPVVAVCTSLVLLHARACCHALPVLLQQFACMSEMGCCALDPSALCVSVWPSVLLCRPSDPQHPAYPYMGAVCSVVGCRDAALMPSAAAYLYTSSVHSQVMAFVAAMRAQHAARPVFC